MLTVNIIGAGAVGQTLGYLWAKQQIVQIQAVVNRSIMTTNRAIAFMGQGTAYASVAELPAADLILITVPDQQITEIAQALASNPNLKPGTIALHCSGALTAECLAPLRARNVGLASIHPAFSFSNPIGAVQQFSQVPCALEGDESILPIITALFTDIGAKVYRISAESKAMYHVAAVFASNYSVTLLQQAYDSFLAAGLSPHQAKAVVERLAACVVQNLQTVEEPKSALTGPIQRGDVTTIERHLQELTDPMTREFYVILANKTLALTTLDESSRQQIEVALSSV